ncbi:MAG TPA: DUF2357 domain-containing protein [Candidatus Anaerobiospirillum pullistercoris]|uniref:DUF2357 domain-containing protein n=1 Tax=Candidatus Anaerobiospirillum pullistercoris TaxID=2838452 RepID=A0A9D2B1Y8_9GAMM|nr:DUF2357 domain-containing protein [Candidatus Anaerobiospirillum pullistercoris]
MTAGFLSDFPLLKVDRDTDKKVIVPSTHGAVTCAYLILPISTREQSYSSELPLTLCYERDGQSYQFKKKAFIYAYAGEALNIGIYTLPSLISVSSLPYKLQKSIQQTLLTAEPSTPTTTAVTLPLSIHYNGQNIGNIDFVLVSSDKNDHNSEAHYFQYLERWLAFFDYLINYNQTSDFSDVQMVRFADLNRLICQYCGNDEQISRSRILAIAEKASDPLSRIAAKLRKSLINTRKLLPVERINAMDGKCLEYLLRLEGDTLREKAQKNKMRFLGLAKEETYNLLENRVLKDFLERCITKSTQYILEIKDKSNRNRALANSSITHQMNIFKQRCQELSQKSPLAAVPRQPSLPKPNFVLQKDPDYKKIWQMYLDLIHEKRDLDKTIYCQQNLFQDICDLLINAALCDLADSSQWPLQYGYQINTIGKSYVHISREQINGHRIKLGCEAGPFLIQSPSSVYTVEVITFGSEKLNSMGLPNTITQLWPQVTLQLMPTAPSFLLFTKVSSIQDLREPVQHVLVPLYSMHCALRDESERDSLLLKLPAMFKDLLENRASSSPAIPIYPCFLVSTEQFWDLKELKNFSVQREANMVTYRANAPTYKINTICTTKPQSLSQADKQTYNAGKYNNNIGIKVIAGTNNRNLTRNKVCPSCFMSTITVSPDEWLQCLESMEVMISSIIHDITTQES